MILKQNDFKNEKELQTFFENNIETTILGYKLIDTELSNTGHWDNGDYCVTINNEDEIDNIIPLIKQYLKVNKKQTKEKQNNSNRCYNIILLFNFRRDYYEDK